MKRTIALLIIIGAALTATAKSGDNGGEYCPSSRNPDCADRCCTDERNYSLSPAPLDPVNLAFGTQYSRDIDVTLATATGPLDLIRMHNASPLTWAYGEASDSASLNGLKPPFGAGRKASSVSPNWFTNYWSFAMSSNESDYQAVEVSDMNGVISNFDLTGISITAYPDGGGAYVTNQDKNMDSPDVLSPNGIAGFWSSFTLYRDDGVQLLFNEPYQVEIAEDEFDLYYFLGEVRRQDNSTTRTISYQTPPPSECKSAWIDGGLGSACVGDGTHCYPFVHTVTASDGPSIIFHYRDVPVPYDNGDVDPDAPQYECVIGSVTSLNRSDGGEILNTKYYYEAGHYPDGGLTGLEAAGQIAKVEMYDESGAVYHETEYTYHLPDAGPGYVVSEVGSPVASFVYDVPDSYSPSGADGFPQVQSLKSSSEEYAFGPAGSATAPWDFTNNSNDFQIYDVPWCDGVTSIGSAGTVKLINTAAGAGDGVSYSPSRTVVVTNNDASGEEDQRPVDVMAYRCDGGNCKRGQTGVVFDDSAGNYPGKEDAFEDGNGNFTVFRRDAGWVGRYAPIGATIEGASDWLGSTGGFTTQYSYNYPSINSVAPYQEINQVKTPGAYNGGTVTTTYLYTSNNFLSGVLRTGYTRTFIPASQVWSDSSRTMGIFLLRGGGCSGASADVYSRVTEVHGPCWANATLTECDESTDVNAYVPVTAYTYYPTNSMYGNSSGRLHYALEYPKSNHVSGSCGTALQTEYRNYDTAGNAQTVIDPNGVETDYQFSGSLVTQAKTNLLAGGTVVWNYGYDNGQLYWVERPAPDGTAGNDYEVYCHRVDPTNPQPASCDSTKAWSDQVQWKAKAPSSTGLGWTEMVSYTYWNDGTVKTESFIVPGPEVRQVRSFGSDANRNLAIASRGDGGADKWLYDGVGNPVGVGAAFDGPANLCGGYDGYGRPSDGKCEGIVYNRLNRPVDIEQAVASGSRSVKSCIDYDSAQNVYHVWDGCAVATPGDCSICGGASAATAEFLTDDFGNIVQVKGQWERATSGQTNYTFDAMGDMLIKNPWWVTDPDGGSNEWTADTYDGLGRKLVSTRWWSGGAHSEALFTYKYDTDGVGTVCGTDAHTKGRLRYQGDSSGSTWYSYDEFGRVTSESRVRADGGCNATASSHGAPDTLFTYDAAGDLTSVTYPYGRKVFYIYDGGTPDRVSSVDVLFYDDAGNATERNILSNAAWEPFGGLRGYQINTFDGGAGSVEYLSGATNAFASRTCSSMTPGISDQTGRTRELMVQTGTFTAGGLGGGRIYLGNYRYSGGLLTGSSECVLSQTTSALQSYNYDPQLRLTSAETGRYTGTQNDDSFSIATYTYSDHDEGMGGVTDVGNARYDLDGTEKQRLNALNRLAYPDAGADPHMTYWYKYTNGGVTTTKYGSSNDAGVPYVKYELDPGPGVNGSSATDSEYRAIGVNGAFSSYYYDAKHRRREKVYPAGARDEFYYLAGSEMIVDQGNDTTSAGSVTYHPVDDYVWLGGRPIAVIRERYDLNWWRNGDGVTTCGRNGDYANCGLYFMVTDPQGKPVVMLDWGRRVVGTGSYDPSGEVNHVKLAAETAHPVTVTSVSPVAVTSLTQAPASGITGLDTQYRTRVSQFDENCSVYPGATTYAQTVTPASGGTSYSWTWGGCTMGNYWFPWLPMVSNSAKVSMVTSTGTVIAQGMTVDAYEYRRAATGMQPFWTPMRYPGQYKDDETGLFQNWNRFYDPDGERMLSPEPMWQTPKPILATAKTGVEWPVYGYAANNSLNSVDPNGLYPMDSPSWDRLAESQLAIDRAAANGDPASQVMVGSAFAVTGVAAVATGALAYEGAGAMLFMAGVRYPMVGATLGMGAGGATTAAGVGGVCQMSQTVLNHAATRPYVNSVLTVQEIMAAGEPVLDPGGSGGLRWDVPGAFDGAEGTWQLVVGPNGVVYHYMFTTK